MKRYIIFDFDGVIVDLFSVCLAVNQMYDPEITEDEYRIMFSGNIYDAIEARGQRTKIDPYPTFDFFAEYAKKIGAVKPVVGIQEVLEEAKNSGCQMFIVSSTDSKTIKDYLDMNGLGKYFVNIYGSDIEKSKVKRFYMIQKTTGAKPEDMLFITDTLGDLIEADKGGIDSVAVSYGFHDKDLLTKAPKQVPIIDDIRELSALIEKDFDMGKETNEKRGRRII